jgi:hypothetical protein
MLIGGKRKQRTFIPFDYHFFTENRRNNVENLRTKVQKTPPRREWKKSPGEQLDCVQIGIQEKIPQVLARITIIHYLFKLV